MKTLAIIAEYNPFHNGHRYHLERSKEMTGADYALSLMSGNFLQRGHAAMWDKYTRAQMCVSAGIDLALELPFCYATGSAMDFAGGAISILNSLNTVDYLCFGAETDSLTDIERIADIILEEPDGYSELLKDKLANGVSYPSARAYAVTTYTNSSNIRDILSSPNNILATEYVCALKRTGSSIKPVLVPRVQAGYHDTTLYGSISSATAIRAKIMSSPLDSAKYKDIISDLKKELPESTVSIITDSFMKSAPVLTDDLTPFLQGCILSTQDFSHICDINSELSDKITHLRVNTSFDTASKNLKSKNITMSRISRCLIHLLLGYTNEDRENFINNGYSQYANILSFRSESSSLIKMLNQNGSIPVITKKADFSDRISTLSSSGRRAALRMWELDTKATELFNCLIYNRYGTVCTNDYNTPIPIIN